MVILLLSLLALCWILVVYHHLIFPLILRRLRKVKSAVPVSAFRNRDLPEITLLVPAYNEVDVIADKVRNIASLDYPRDKLNLIIACDGCTDDTAIKALKTAAEPENKHLQIEVAVFPENGGKVAILNKLIPTIKSEIVGLSDASALISIDALYNAAAQFTDPKIGVVAPTYRILQPGSEGEAAYWRYQTGVKLGEAALGAPMGAHGALYFFRREAFCPLEADTINDDFILPMRMVADGYRAVYDTEIVALELEQATTQMDLNRRKRIAAGNLQQLLRLPKLLLPRYKGIAFSFFSGKGLRAVMPLILLCQLLICALLSVDSIFMLALTLLQLAVIIGAAIAPNFENRLPHALNVLSYLVNGYRSSLEGILRYLVGLEKGRWKRVSEQEI